MLHIAKLAVGVASVDHLRALQGERSQREPPLRHRTRHMPRQRDEVLAGGSLYWVVCGVMCVRQRIVDLVNDPLEDGSPAAAFVLDAELVRTEARPVRAFQGWRYLLAETAPADLGTARDYQTLPAELLLELRTLCLI